MRNSAVQPVLVVIVLTSQLPSQVTAGSPWSRTCASYWMPAALVPKTKPFCWSRYVSKTIWKESISSSTASRRVSVVTICEGSESYRVTPT